MGEFIELLIHCMVTLVKLLRPGGIKTIMAENLAMRQQLIAVNRGRSRPPRLTSRDRFLFGLQRKVESWSKRLRLGVS